MKRKSAKEVKAKIGETAVKETKKIQERRIIKEAYEVYDELSKLVQEIPSAKLDDVLEKLQNIHERLENLLKEGKLEQVPIRSVVYEFVGVNDNKEAKKLIEKARNYIEDNDIVSARNILNLLRNEIIIDTYIMPLGVFKKAVSLAIEFAKFNDWEKLLKTLNMAINSLKLTKTIIPKPIIEAYYLVEEASKLFREEPEETVEILKYARSKLELSKILGYIRDEKTIQPILQKIENLEGEVKLKKAQEGTFKAIEKDIEQVKEEQTKEVKDE